MRHKLDNQYKTETRRRVYDTQLDCVWEAVNRVCDVPSHVIAIPCREQQYVTARFFFFYLARMRTACTWKNIGFYAGGRDHSTVMHGFQQVVNWLSYDKSIQEQMKRIEEVLEARFDAGDELFGPSKRLQYGFI